MGHALLDRPAWYVLGPLIGLVVVGLLVTINERFGVLGGYSNVVRLLAGAPTVADGYGWLTRAFSGSGQIVVGLLLLVAGVLIGFGAKTAGGCTSGNGLGACSAGSTAGFVATATFMGTAIVATFAIRAVT
jgi:uncharacterized protein